MYGGKDLNSGSGFGAEGPCERSLLGTSQSRAKRAGGLFVWCFVLVVMVAIAAGGVRAGASGRSEVAEEVGTDELIQSITFKKDVSIRDALTFLALKYDKNIVPSSQVDGLLTFQNLRDVTFKEAMDAILGANFKYEQKGNLIRVYSKEEYKKVMEDEERMISKVFKLYYISAAEAMKLISPVLSKAGTMHGSTPAEITVPTGESISTGSAGGDTMALNDTIVILDYPENIAEAERLIEELDVRPLQVLVEATILSAKLEEGMEFGIDWNLLDGFELTGFQAIYDSKGAPMETHGFATLTDGLRVGIQSGTTFAFINALETVTDTTILANPKILAVNKQLGQVYIGNKIGYVSTTTQNASGSTTQEVEFLETGTKLSFRPYIGDDGYIRMDIQPKDSSGVLKTNNIPDETSTELATNIMVKDGQTIVIGGLFRDVVVTTRSQVPLLGDLPFIGVLFRGTDDNTERQEVIVMLTPHIMEEPSETEGEARADDIRRKRFGAKDGLQWADRARLVEDRYTEAAKYYLAGDNKAALRELGYVLEVRPTYLEAIRLKERIVAETDPEMAEEIERNVLETVEQEDTEKWMRR